MAHREDTAQKYYRVFEKSKSSVKASQRLHGIMRNSGHGETVTCSEELPDTEQKNVCEMHATGEQSSCTKRSPWTKDAIEAVQSVFKEEIDAQKISIDTVREKIKLNPCLIKESPKRVYDRIRAEWRFQSPEKSSNAAPVELPKEKETVYDRVNRMFEEEDKTSTCSSDIIPPTFSSRISNVFSAPQLTILLRLCKDMTFMAPISKRTITSRLEKDSEGKVLLTEVSMEQIVNRLKYERKQRRSESNKAKKGFD